MSLIVKQLVCIHPDKEVLFSGVSFSLPVRGKAALVGNNGTGKSTLLRMLAGESALSGGELICASHPYYIPQHFGQYDEMSVAGALKIEEKITALNAISGGSVEEKYFEDLGDDWEVEERSLRALDFWGLAHISLSDPMGKLSGGEKTKVFLAGIAVHQPEIILMDEPSNHLDLLHRNKLYDLIRDTNATILIVSHDRTLLNQLEFTYELGKHGITLYGGNYDFYKEQKEKEIDALQTKIEEKEKALRKAHKVAREVAERKQRQNARGKEKLEKEGMPRIMVNTIKNKAEQSRAKLTETHAEKIGNISDELNQSKQQLPDLKKIRVNVEDARLHTGKLLLRFEEVNFTYTKDDLWGEPLSFEIRSGERIAIKGNNGSGKTTLLKLITGALEPGKGKIERNDFEFIYLDQEYSLIDNRLSLFEQIRHYNERNLQEHELKMILHRYLFPKEVWDKSCGKLSGGEKMRLIFCCLMVYNNTPDMFILDEPTNNLDIQSLQIVTAALRDYKGTLLVISHDRYFLEEIGGERELNLPGKTYSD